MPLKTTLSPQEKNLYQKEGLVKPDYSLPRETVERMLILTERTLAATVGQPSESIVCPYLPGWNGLPEVLICVIFSAVFIGVEVPPAKAIWEGSGPQIM